MPGSIFSFSLLKLQNKMAAKIADKVSVIMIIHHVWVHSGHTNLTFVFKITCFEEFHVLRPGRLSRKKFKMAANNTESTITFFKSHRKLFLVAKYRFLIPINLVQYSNNL